MIRMQIPPTATHFEPGIGFWWREPNIVQASWAMFCTEGWRWVDTFPHGAIRVEALDRNHFEQPRRSTSATEVWDGTGLPPVGTVCETDHRRKQLTVKILAYGDHCKDKCVMVADMSNGYEGKMYAWIAAQGTFRPIRTAEQLAAEEREAWIKEVVDITEHGVTRNGASRLYAAGYRKFEIVDEVKSVCCLRHPDCVCGLGADGL